MGQKESAQLKLQESASIPCTYILVVGACTAIKPFHHARGLQDLCVVWPGVHMCLLAPVVDQPCCVAQQMCQCMPAVWRLCVGVGVFIRVDVGIGLGLANCQQPRCLGVHV
jgi:hypothetical protein